MQKSFEYLEIKRCESSITIEDIGNAYLRAYTDIGEEYYLSLETKLGFTTVTQFGGMVEGKMHDGYFSYVRFTTDYEEGPLSKIIKKWLKQEGITQVFEIDKNLFYDIKKNIKA